MQLKFSSNTRMTLVAFLSCTALVTPSFVGAATTVPAKTSWAVSRVASVTQGSYCTMAQKYDDSTVLTFARNIKGEYSLAVDFQNPQFKSGQKQTITLRPQGGAAQTYSITPQSDKTAVVGIGKDAAMIKQISSTENLGIEIAGSSLSFGLSQFSSGQKELGSCIEALQTTNNKDAELVKSQQTGISSPEATINRQVAVVNATAPSTEPSVEGLLAAKPTPSVGVSALSSDDVAPVPVAPKLAAQPIKSAVIEQAPVVEVKQPQVIVDEKAVKEVASLREENARLMRAMSEQRQAFENKQPAVNSAVLDELRQKLEAAKVENDKLRLQQMNGADQKNQFTKLNADLQSATQSVQSLQTENQSLKNQLASQTAAVAKVGAASSDVAKVNQSLEVLRAENATLKNQIQLYQSKQTNVETTTSELAKIQTENAQLKAQLAARPATEMPKAQVDDTKVASLTAELAQQKQNIATLQSENATLKNQIQIYAKAPAPVVTPAPVAAANPAETEKLQKEVRQLRVDMETAKAEKTTLQTQLSKLQADTDGKQIKMAGGSWDLEQATRRYQESQREIQRLGAALQTQQAQCTKEKKEIEYMLFDPAIAKSSQIAMLNSLEEQIAEKDKKIKDMEAGLSSTQEQSSPDKDKKIAELQKQLDVAKADMAKKIQQVTPTQDAVIASLKDELAKKDKAVFDAQAKLAESQNKGQQADVVQNQSLTVLKTDLAQKTQQLAEANIKIQQLAQQSAPVPAQQTLINTLQAQLADAQKQLVEARTNAQQVDAKTSADQASALATMQLQIQQGNQKVAELQNQISNLKSASVPAPVAAAPVSLAPAPTSAAPFVQPKPAQAKFLSMDEFSGILKTAGVPVSGALQQVQGGDPASYRAYSWKTDSLYGSVEMRQAPSADSFDTVIGQYLGRAKSRCSGEFAAVPSSVKASGVSESKSYEIACVNQGASSSASVLFTYGNGVAMTVAHEGRAEAMDMAMDARDRVAGKIR